ALSLYQMIPLFIDFSGRRIVIFGGGAVAARKAAYFADEARVLVVSRSFVHKIETLPVKKKSVDLDTASDAKLISVIGNAFLVIGALSDPVQNNRIGRLCHKKGILFNNADGEAGDVVFPAISSGKNFILAISTGGSSPAISRFIREHIEQELPELDAMIVLQNRLRAALKNTEPDQARRNAILRKVLDDPWVWKILKTDPDTSWEKVSARFLHD
ncbi:MAG: bifunctional precorrin-2 dehydrogenase/sirohydrochlorin ferrochelatase, partial [Methanoregula sp.]|nr:bifunctional precorrin-2 dehydrogenase/sirohydrochlorin ferrochelatase [Methanoregula sp.]